MTPACVGFLPDNSRPLIIRSAPSQDSYWLNDGNCPALNCAYFWRADCICRVPAFGSWNGRKTVGKYPPCTAFQAGDPTMLDSYPVGKTTTLGLTPAARRVPARAIFELDWSPA